MDVQGADDDSVPIEGGLSYHSSPHKLASNQFLQLTQACEQKEKAELVKEVRAHDLARENSGAKLAAVARLALLTLTPSSAWLGAEVNGATPMKTSIRHSSPQSVRECSHLSEKIRGIGLGVLRAVLAAGYTIRCYTYIDYDGINRRIAWEVVLQLHPQFLEHLLYAAIRSFDKRLQKIGIIGEHPLLE